MTDTPICARVLPILTNIYLPPRPYQTHQ